jgi:hypothetical protein
MSALRKNVRAVMGLDEEERRESPRATAARTRRERYMQRFLIVGEAYNSTLRHLRTRQSLRHAFQVPALYSRSYADMGPMIGREQFVGAMNYAYRPDEMVIATPELGKLYCKLFRVFDLEGKGLVNYQEFLCVLTFFGEHWDVRPQQLIHKWFRFHDGDLGSGVTRTTLMKIFLLLAVTKEEAMAVMDCIDQTVLDEVLTSPAAAREEDEGDDAVAEDHRVKFLSRKSRALALEEALRPPLELERPKTPRPGGLLQAATPVRHLEGPYPGGMLLPAVSTRSLPSSPSEVASSSAERVRDAARVDAMRSTRFTKSMLDAVMGRSPQLMAKLNELRLSRAPPTVRARTIQQRMLDEMKVAEEQHDQVRTQIGLGIAVRHWKLGSMRAWFEMWIRFVCEQKVVRLKIWRYRARKSVQRWFLWTRSRRVRRQQHRLAALSGCHMIQRRALRTMQRWIIGVKELRFIQVARARDAFRIRLQMTVFEAWKTESDSAMMRRRFQKKLCRRVLGAWKRFAELSQQERRVMEVAGMLSGIQVHSIDELHKAEEAVTAANRADAAAKQQAVSQTQDFFHEAETAAAIDQESEEFTKRIHSEIRVAKTRQLQASKLQQAHQSTRQWALGVRRAFEKETATMVNEERETWEARISDMASSIDDEANLPPLATAPSFESLATDLLRSGTEALLGAVTTAGRCLMHSEAPASLRQRGSPWVLEVDESGTRPLSFMHAQLEERVDLSSRSWESLRPVAVAHLRAAVGAQIQQQRREGFPSHLAFQARLRLGGMLLDLRARRIARKTAERVAAELVEELVDPATGEMFYVCTRSRVPLARKPAFLKFVVLRPMPDWTLRTNAVTGEAHYENRSQPWRSRAEPPKGLLRCFVCQQMFADRRCAGPGCDGYCYCWSCWSQYHPLDSDEFRDHEFERLVVGKVHCTGCAVSPAPLAQCVVWTEGYPFACVDCKTTKYGEMKDSIVPF